MTQVSASHSDNERMELRALIRVASEIIAYYWPMRSFVHHNPLHGLESLEFEDAVREGERVLGGRSYLPGAIYRDYFQSRRIAREHLDAALQPRVLGRAVDLGPATVAQADVLRACLLHDLQPPAADCLEALLARHPDRALVVRLAERIEIPPAASGSDNEAPALDTNMLLGAWCDRQLGTDIAETINREMIKWCEAFLDEGHATWPMPGREKGFYGVWKILVQHEWSPCGIKNSRQKAALMPRLAEDAVLDSLRELRIAPNGWKDYLTLHLAALPGWTGFIKWRADQNEYEWQNAYPIDLAQYLAVRLWYERQLVQRACRQRLGIDGNRDAISANMQKQHELRAAQAKSNTDTERRIAAWRIVALARALGLDAAVLAETAREDLLTLLAWLDGFPPSEYGPVWLKALESGYREQLLLKLSAALPWAEPPGDQPAHEAPAAEQPHSQGIVRPQAQAVFCIDVRSEPLRRHLEAIGDYETFGFAGFFAAFIRHQAFGSDHETDQFPVIVKSKNLVREIPRTYHGRLVLRHRRREKLVETGHSLIYDLKENVFTPYVMVESLGWFYSIPLVGKTLCPSWYRSFMDWLRHKLVPPVATTLTVDKLSRDEVQEMIAAEQRAVTRRALQEKFGDRNLNLSLERLEFLRRRALDEDAAAEPSPQARSTALSSAEEAAFIDDLRRDYGINQRAYFARMERITRTGFTVAEQVLTVETALRMMGLTRNFARLVLICGHGSSSENNPFEAALDCGACGGNAGKPNARVVAIMANRAAVREQLARNGIAIPQDTYFLAGLHNTATDDIDLFDLEDLPPTHRKDLLQLIRDLERAGARTSRERCSRFPAVRSIRRSAQAKHEVRRRSRDWSQVRPEWGLSGNAAFIIGRRTLTRGVRLDGRVFLHSYDYRSDCDGRLLEAIMTGPQVVGQWINMEHYFSTVDPEFYGSGSKIYHNVVGRLGVMSGPQSDLRTGLAWQTVMNGERPFHEAMRLLTLVEAPRQHIDKIIGTQRHLRHLYDNAWLHLIAIEPEEGAYYRYVPRQGWERLEISRHENSNP